MNPADNNNNEPSFLEMDDATVMAMSSPTPIPAGSAEGDDTPPAAAEAPQEPAAAPSPAAEEDGEDAGAANNDGSDAGAPAGPNGAAAGGDGTGEGQGDGDGAGGGATPEDEPGKPPAKPDTAPNPADKLQDGKPADKPAATSTVDFESVGKAVMTPFKANGKDFQVQSADEAVKLMQMGVNYTKKMQELQPVKRIITMLSNNQLLDEGKLAYLIDLDKKNPQAIQKLLADSNFDPHAVDKDAADSYTPGQHQVSDLEVQFAEALDEVAASPTGSALISEVQGQWDQASKQALFQNPALLRQINEHKAMGLYDVIHAEVERQRTLGQIPAGTPYLQAYKAMGDMLHTQGRLVPPQQAQAPAAPAVITAPVETRVVTPPAQVVANDKAKAAAPTKSTRPAAPAQINYLDMPDEDFQKQLAGRV